MSAHVRRIASPQALADLCRSIRESPRSRSEKLYVCTGGGCIASGSLLVRDALRRALADAGLADTVAIVETGCLGPCAVGPVVVVGRDRTFYQNVKRTDATEIVTSHLLGNRPVLRLLHHETATHRPVVRCEDVPFLKRQSKVLLRRCGVIDPNRIEDYIGDGGYAGAAKALTAMTPAQVIEEVKRSGLRGRGGAGFSTGAKWQCASASTATPKYILCNADEGDPGAYMDRSVLEGDPHSVIEGMIIGGFAIGARQGYVYVRAEYPLAVERLDRAIAQARDLGLLGANLLGSGFDFDLEIRMGSGAFVCGEETALMASIEGRRGEPRPRPPFPAQKGLWDKPTVLNNVETFANVAAIIERGSAWYAAIGTTTSTGTKVFALAGAINVSGLVEVPIGTTLRDVVFEVGGGIRNKGTFKAAQIGGPSGGCIPAKHLDAVLDYEPLSALGAIMGSGGLIVMDQNACMVDVARFFLEFVQDESCGKCVPCREGTRRMLDILKKICDGRGAPADLDLLTELANTVKASSLCGLGQTAPNPVLSTLRHFPEEYAEHINEHKCRAAVCKALIVFEITHACTGCGACRRICPASAITGAARRKHTIDKQRCTRCGLCRSACTFNAIVKY